MEQYLYKYLLLNQKLSIPGLGNFVIEYQSAYYNEPTGLLFPRKPVIEFYEAPGTIAERNLFYFLAKEMAVDELSASNTFQQFCGDLVTNLLGQQVTDIAGIGKVKKEIKGQVTFIPASSLIDILPPLRFSERTKGYPSVEQPKTVVMEAPAPAITEEIVAPVETVVPAEVISISRPVKAVEKELVKEVKEVKMGTGTEAVIGKEPRSSRISSPELDALNAEVEKIRQANELRALKEKEEAGAVVVEMHKSFLGKLKSLKENWWLYPAALALAGLIALLVKVL